MTASRDAGAAPAMSRAPDTEPQVPSRRTFVARAAAAGAAASVGGTLAGAIALVGGCGGGGGSDPALPTTVTTGNGGNPPVSPPDSPPVWQAVPDITFTEGVASSFPIAAFVSDADGNAVAIATNGVALPEGVTFDPVGKRFVYDGIGAAGSASGVMLIADDGVG